MQVTRGMTILGVMAFVASFIVFDDQDISTKFLFGALAWLVLAFLSALPVFSSRRRTIEAEVGLNGIRTPHTFIGFERLVSVLVGSGAHEQSVVLLTDNGDKLILAVAGQAEEVVALIDERWSVHVELTRTRKVSSDGYRNVRVEEGVDGDLVDAMRNAGMNEHEVAECLAIAHGTQET